MDANDAEKRSRREFLETAGAVAASVALAGLPLGVRVAAGANGPGMKIGIIGSGRIGGTLGGLWVKAGHEVMLSARNLDPVQKLIAGLGPMAHAGTPKEAADFGDVVLISVPYGALPQLGRDLAGDLKGKVVLDTCNPSPGRDGDMAVAARAKGTGVASPEYLPGVRLVRAFNTVPSGALRSEAHRAGEQVAVPLAADDQAALKIAMQLVQDAGFEPVVVGGLARAKEFDPGTPVFGKALTAAELRRALGLGS
jgi:predicted dinucleotide-binding enzyme